MMTPEEKQELYGLLNSLCEGTITDEEFHRLETRLKSDKEACRIYVDFTLVWSDLQYFHASTHSQHNHNTVSIQEMLDGPNSFTDSAIWKALADAEKDAPAVEIAPVQEPRDPAILIQKVQHQKVIRKISKSTLIPLFAAAAVIFLVLFIRFEPTTGIKVAVLSDTINARWADMDRTMEKGTPILTSRDDLFLRQGYAELRFDNNSRITIEGPAEFQIISEDMIKLNYGKLYASIPQEAIGFTVNTPNARVIDLGTEFGIKSNTDGDTYLHVIQGTTTLIAGRKSNKVSMEVNRGNAKKVAGTTSAISNIPCDTNLFVRRINSEDHFIWKGQNKLALADIAGGGNGFGTGTTDKGIDPGTGKVDNVQEGLDRTASNAYRTLPGNPLVDGVFVPNGKTTQIVTSQGHVFDECPVTCGNFYTQIANTPRMAIVNPWKAQEADNTLDHSFLLLHANAGITFDLNAIRRELSSLKINRFESYLCISQTAPDQPNGDFWVLVDGKVRYSKKNVTQKDFDDFVSIELDDNDRFLTLVTTDGGDPENRIRQDGLIMKSINSDWGVFAEPVLILE